MIYLESRKLWRSVLLAMMIPLGLIAFWPSPVDAPVQGQLADFLKFIHAHGIPAWVNYKFVETSANVLLFIPIGVVAALGYPKRSWWQIGVLGLTISGCIELGQLLFLHNRFASPLDLATNTGGAVIGGLLVTAALKRLQAGPLVSGRPVGRHRSSRS